MAAWLAGGLEYPGKEQKNVKEGDGKKEGKAGVTRLHASGQVCMISRIQWPHFF